MCARPWHRTLIGQGHGFLIPPCTAGGEGTGMEKGLSHGGRSLADKANQVSRRDLLKLMPNSSDVLSALLCPAFASHTSKSN